MDKLEFIVSSITALSIMTGAGLAVYGTLVLGRRDSYLRRVNTFRTLHDLFWQDDNIARVRNWIISNVEYDRWLRPVLVKRNATKENSLSEEENLILDQVDRFCAILVRILSYSESKEMKTLAEWESRIWNKILHARFWMEKIYSEQRKDLYKYISQYWSEILPKGAPEEYDPSRPLYLK